MLEILLLAFALAMDAFAVSIGAGICVPGMRLFYALRASFAFGLFQFGMPLVGWLLGGAFRSYIQGIDHWIAFGLLAFVGARMVIESFAVKENGSCSDEGRKKADVRKLGTLLVLSVATSVDAMAVGLSYSVVGTPILLPAAAIGAITFLLCAVGVEFGKRIGARFERWAELAGGLVLIAIGTRILIEHLAE